MKQERLVSLVFVLLFAAFAGTSLSAQAGRGVHPPSGSAGPVVSAPVAPANNLDLAPVPPLPAAPLAGGEAGEAAEPRMLPGSLLLAPAKLAAGGAASRAEGDAALQTRFGPGSMPAPAVSFEGIGNIDGVYPPDTDGSIGPNHYVQMVNLSTAVYDKNGALLYGPFRPGGLWPSGDPCRHDAGDIVVLYDRYHDRWVLSQFAFPNYPAGPYYECIAVSKGPVPTNVPADYWTYTFVASATKMNDYPKLALWPDGLYMTANQFTGGGPWGGAGVWAFDYAKMLAGQSATFQYFDLFGADPNFGGMLPVDLEGAFPPPANTPAFFLEVDDSSWIEPEDAMRIWQFHVDWADPANTTFGDAAHRPNYVLPVANFDLLPCVVSQSRSCIPQQGSTVRLDAVADRLMFRATYRNFGDHSSVVVNHTVKADGVDRAGIRWYEVRNVEFTPTIEQQGTFAPADGLYRWMGSMTTDRMGNIALGYSVSGSSIDPSIRYAGRFSTDPSGDMTQGEAAVIAGSGAQTGVQSRWGDYSAMAIDPTDDCTFWYTQEYIQTTGPAPWRTRIASFKFPTCASEPSGMLTGTVTAGGSSQPIQNAQVRATDASGQGAATNTNVSGAYSLLLATGTYTVDISAYGYAPASFPGQVISQNQTVTLNAALAELPRYVVSGQVFDPAAGWPLYARITIDGSPAASFWTDPATGAYSVTLVAGTDYAFHVAPFVPGYVPAVQNTGTLAGDLAFDIPVTFDAAACSAPGYVLDATCHPLPGGLVAGWVRDGNDNSPLIGATVTSDTGGQAVTAATPLDPAQGDFYVLFQPAGTHALTAAMPGFGPQSFSVTVPLGGAAGRNFVLPAGRLSYTPPRVDATLLPGAALTVPVTITNTGTLAAHVQLLEIAGGLVPAGVIEQPAIVTKPWRWDLPSDAEALPPRIGPTPPYAGAGATLQTWAPAGLAAPWGIAFDPAGDTVWVSSPGGAWNGGDGLYEYGPDGAPTGRAWSYTPALPHANGPADLAFNWKTGTLWAMNVNSGAGNCIYEIDPASGPTGHKICPQTPAGFTTSQRGLAYDPQTDTWFAGGWNDQMLYRFDGSGTLLAGVNVGINIAGLAYNPATGHLFALQNGDAAFYVLDVNDGYKVLGRFSVPGLASAGSGLEFACDGALWAVGNDVSTVYRIASGEPVGPCGTEDVPWLSETPTQATVAPGASVNVSVTLDAAGLAAGVYAAQLKLDHDTPYTLSNLPVTMRVVPATYGHLLGTVTTTGYCDAGSIPLPGVPVTIRGGSLAQPLTFGAGPDGSYDVWLDATSGPYTVSVNAGPDYAPGSAAGVVITVGQQTVLDFALRWLKPCISTFPGSFDVKVPLGATLDQPLTLFNDGGAATSFSLGSASYGNVTPAPSASRSSGVPDTVPWLTTTPGSGVLAADGSQAAVVHFNAGAGIGSTGVYTAFLKLNTSDPMHPILSLPVTMRVSISIYLPLLRK